MRNLFNFIKENKLNIIILVSILILGFLAYFFIIKPAINVDTSLDSNPYNFYIFKAEKRYIRDFYFSYDFDKKEGTLNLRLGPKRGLSEDKIGIKVPEELHIDKNETVIGGECRISAESWEIVPEEVTIDANNTETCLIQLKLIDVNNSFIPNGLFTFSTSSDELTTKFNEADETVINKFLDLNFANNYRCSEVCYIPEIVKTNLTFNANSNKFILYVRPNSDENLAPVTRFIINTYNFKKKVESERNLALGISLISGLVIFFLTIFVSIIRSEIHSERRYLDKKANNLVKEIKEIGSKLRRNFSEQKKNERKYLNGKINNLLRSIRYSLNKKKDKKLK